MFSMETKCAFTYTRQILNENKYPKPSSKTVTNGDEGEVHGGNARALGEVVRLDLTLDDLLVTGVYHRNAQCSSTKRLYFLQ